METPDSMKSELQRWNNGAGIDLDGWANCSGNYELAVGYLAIFWPEFEEFEGYILQKGFSIDSLRGFENQTNNERKSVEWVMNHVHIADIHMGDDAKPSEDKFIAIGNVMREMYQAKLVWQFPHAPCTVEFYIPSDREDFVEYQLSFWQKAHESNGA